MKYSIPARFWFGLFTIVAAILCGSCLSVSAATTYYVDSVGGNDSNSGTSITAAWQTTANINLPGFQFQPGDWLLFKRGDTWTGTGSVSPKGSGTATAPITIDCYDSSGTIGPGGIGALPILTGTGTSTFALVNVQYWTVADLEIDGGSNDTVLVEAESPLPAGTQLNNITLDHLTIRNSGTIGGLFQGGIFTYNDGANRITYNHLVISNCDIENSNTNGIYIQSSVAVQTADVQPNVVPYYNTNVQITSNYIALTHMNGIIAAGCKDVLISQNTVYKAGANANTSSRSFVGIFPQGSYGGTIEYNTVSYTVSPPTLPGDSQAFDLDEGCAGVFYFQYNYTHDNSDGFFETTHNALNNLIPGVTDRCIVRYNVSSNDNLNAKLGGSWLYSFMRLCASTQEFYNNTFYCPAGSPAVAGSTGPIVLLTWAPGTPARMIGTVAGPTTTQTTWKDNIFYCPGGFEPLNSGTVGNITATYDHNCFYSGNGGQGTNQIDADPQFLDPSDTTAGLQLALTSPAINLGLAGVTMPSPQVDFYNYAYDLGTTPGAAQQENVMYYQFENNLADSSGHANNGMAGGSGNTFPSSGMFAGSYCLSLNGSGYVSVANSTSTALMNNQLCIDLWVKLSVAPSGYRELVNKMTPGGTDGFFLDLTPTNQLRFNVRGYQITTTGTVPTTGAWTHVVATYQTSASMAVYINGAFDSDLVTGVDPIWAATNTHPFLIGADQSFAHMLVGELDNVRIERSTLAPSDPLESTNVMLFPLENNVTDSSGNGNNGTLAGTGTTFPSTGALLGSYCMSLNGSGYVTIPNSTSTGLMGNDLGIDLWVNLSVTPSGYRRLVDKMTAGGVDGFFLDLTPTNQVRFNVRGTQVITTGTVPNTSTWTHIVAIYRANATMSVYINGVIDPTGSATTPNLPIWASTNTWPFHIGADNQTPSPGSKLIGELDNVEIWRSSDFFQQQ